MTQPVYTPEMASQLAGLLAGSFIERRDVMAVQVGHMYMPVVDASGNHPPFTRQALIDHLQGVKTYGHYLVSSNNTCRIFAFDIDLNKSSPYHSPETGEDLVINPREVWLGPTTQVKMDLALQLKALAHGLAIRTKRITGCKVTVHYSGCKGMHVTGLLDPGTSATEARDASQLVLDSFDDTFELFKGKNFWRHKHGYPSLELETFPKQGEVRSGDGLGNLLRLPLGIHRKTNKASFFLDMNTPLDVFRADDPVLALTEGSLRG